ncbi:MAG: YbeD family protein [Steroidobacteraceae bacterium]
MSKAPPPAGSPPQDGTPPQNSTPSPNGTPPPNGAAPQVEPPHLEFPADYPIKVIGRASGQLRAEADAIIGRHAPDYVPGTATERLSANGNFLSISYVIRAVSAAQVAAIAADLKACESVLLAL